ncbi:hypothetical protein [Paenarthrobacter nitroguajacolicus]|uniref:hypothetical protein n=1 Tax=Paenarthrobacter nitroguajacolicus TaxID=211146 RepID=UPI001ABFB0B4|nr:hypothetical protein [Paenarthrobacter nitroguajacolicus]
MPIRQLNRYSTAGRNRFPKAKDGPVECLRILRAGRTSALKARTAAINQIKGLLVSAPDKLRAKYRGLGTSALITALQRTRPSGHLADSVFVCLLTLKALAARCQSLSAEIATADAELQEIIDTYAPMICDLPASAPKLPVSCWSGSPPYPRPRAKPPATASAEAATATPTTLHLVVLVHMASRPRTKDYVAKRTAVGKGKREIMRCLKR